MKAVLLVGGEGTRLRPLTCNTVKAMVPVLNRPFLEHMIRYLSSHGVDDIILALCYLPERIERYLGDGSKFGVRLTYVMEESPLGTAGAVKNAESYLDDLFLVFNGDIFTDIDLRAMLSFHRQRKAKVTIALTPVEDPTAYGLIETEVDGRVKRFLEKPSWDEVTTNLINAGVYVLDREVLQDIPPNTHFMFEHHLFPGLLAKGVPVYGYSTDAYWIDMGTPEKYLQLHRDLLLGKSASTLCKEIRDKEGTRRPESFIHPTAEIEGPVLIGKGCSIGSAVRIKGPTVFGEGCRILDQATIEESVVWWNVEVGQEAILKDCIVGHGTFVGNGSIIPEGSVVGDKVVMIQGSHLMPHTKIWPGRTIWTRPAFEREVTSLYSNSGAKSVVHNTIIDGSHIDLVVEDELVDGSSMITMIECKASAREVDIEIVNAFYILFKNLRYAGKVDKAVIVSSSAFTAQARKAAESFGIELFDIDELKKKLQSIKEKPKRITQVEERKPDRKYVFVLMPFDESFDDIFYFGVRGAVDDADLYCRRVDEIPFTGDVPQEIREQIQRADIIVAEMTGLNPNVFYEVGIAHGLGKNVVLIVQDEKDIPFDLQTQNHIIYGGRIVDLRRKLALCLKSLAAS